MDITTKLCSLLDKKKELFTAFEAATQALLDCDADSVEKYIIERDRLATEIDGVSEEVARLCADEPGGDVLLEIARGKRDFGKVPPEYQCVFYAEQAVRSIGSRIMEMDKQVVERLKEFREKALQSIKTNQNLPKIKKYLTDLTDGQSGASLTSGKA